MASVISISPHSSLAHPYGNHSFGSSLSSLVSGGSLGSAQFQHHNHHHRTRQVSLSSLVSGRSLYAPSWYHVRDRPPARPASAVAALGPHLSLQRTNSSSAFSQPQSVAISSFSDELPDSRPEVQTPAATLVVEKSELSYGTSGLSLLDEEDDASGQEIWHDPSDLPDDDEEPSPTVELNYASRHAASDEHGQTFRRWMSTLRRKTPNPHKNSARHSSHGPSIILYSSPPRVSLDRSYRSRRGHNKSDSLASSLGFITAVKSVSMTIASSSNPSMVHPLNARSPWSRRAGGSSAMSGSEARRSMESNLFPLTPVLDDAARKRSQKRREKVEELIRTEDGYVADLKALSNAFFNILLPQAALSPQAKGALQTNLADLLQLHDEILRELHACLPWRDIQPALTPIKARRPRHLRYKSADAVSDHVPLRSSLIPVRQNRRSLNLSRSSEQDHGISQFGPQLAADISRIFLSKIRRFSAYEEYAARSDQIHGDVDFAQKTLLQSHDYDKAIETLYASINSGNGPAMQHRRALGLKDLLIKPIQRITRYELLFKDLCRLTPSCDDPISHAVLDDMLFAIAQTCQNVNEARDNPERLRLLENQRHLHERLIFQDKITRPLIFQFLGRLSLCGCLFVAYRTKSGVKGQYAVCILYESCLLFATASSPSQYRVLAAAPMAMSKVEESDNGKGLQCHTTPHTWKLVFENQGKLFEVLLAACSATEASVWRDHISGRIAVETKHLAEGRTVPVEISSPLTDDMRSVGKAYGRCNDFTRRLSVHRAATLGPTTDLNQVMIKNTQATKEAPDNASTSSLPISRSQSVATPSHIPVLAPRRTERIQLEHLLSDVWTKDAIPWPGLGPKRSEYNIRASANHVIRKLSMASIASNFSKRSLSYASVSQASIAEMRTPKGLKPQKLKGRNPFPLPSVSASSPMLGDPAAASCASAVLQKSTGTNEQSQNLSKPSVINFHNAPDAFLPEDFDLKTTLKAGRQRLGAGVRSLTMASERPRSPFFGSGTNHSSATTTVPSQNSGSGNQQQSLEPASLLRQQQQQWSQQKNRISNQEIRRAKSVAGNHADRRYDIGHKDEGPDDAEKRDYDKDSSGARVVSPLLASSRADGDKDGHGSIPGTVSNGNGERRRDGAAQGPGRLTTRKRAKSKLMRLLG